MTDKLIQCPKCETETFWLKKIDADTVHAICVYCGEIYPIFMPKY